VEVAVSIAAAGAGALAGALAPRYQHRLYRSEEHRANPASGRKLRLLQAFCAIAAAAAWGLAFRPDYYDAGPATLTALFALILVVLSSTDFDRRIIPNRLSDPAIAVAAALSWAWPDRSATDIALGAGFGLGVAAAMIGFGAVVGALLGSRDIAFGMGDAKLIVLIGLLTGWPGVMTALFYGVLLAGGAAFVFLLRRGWRTVFSYGPYLAAGGVIVMLWVQEFD
jgi:prepilin signal peptidase PulO-like enzyme (type II secretory pathway)